MKLRLQIIPSPDKSFTVEHATPLVRIGRDPKNEVALSGDSSHGVSFDHARIEMTSRGAVLHDLGSTNGTYVNGRRIGKPLRLRVGDQIQLGHKGPRLSVLEIDTVGAPEGEAAAEEQERSRSREHYLVLGGVIAAFCAVAIVTAVLLSGNPPSSTQPQRVSNDKNDVSEKPPEQPPEKPPEQPPEKPPEQPPEKPLTGRQPAGALQAAGAMPSLLLQRSSEKGPWQRVRAGDQVHTGDLLISLPGYRSALLSNGGVRMTLWGNVPEQLNLPLLESAVTLRNPEPGVDLDFTLERGRVVLANGKAAGTARVQVRFADQKWELALEPDSAVGMDLISREDFSGTGEGPLVGTLLGVLQGNVALHTGSQQFALRAPPGPTEFSWANRGSVPSGPASRQELPPWWKTELPAKWQWEKLPAAEQQKLVQAYDAMRQALEGLSKDLGEKGSLRVQLAEAVQAKQPAARELAVFCLGAIDDLPQLLDALADGPTFDVREAAVTALRHWLGRRDGQDRLLRQALADKNYTTTRADTILQLLHTFSADDLAKKQTYELLIEYLQDQSPAVRQLAYWHLVRLAPEGRKIPYDPGAGDQQRKAAYEQWQKLLADGKLPPRAPPPKP